VAGPEIVNQPPHSYLVDPSMVPVALAPALTVLVCETDGKTSIPGATVEIVDGGPETGRVAVTGSRSAYCNVNALEFTNVTIGIPLTIAVSKSGYVPASQTVSIADAANGYPIQSGGTFRLQRLQ
jgi:hypothetical protein